MKWKLIVGGIIALALTATAVIVSAKLSKDKGSDQFEAAGAGIKESAAAMPENDSKNSVPGESDIMGEVCGQNVTKLYFELRYSPFKAHPLNYANPKEKAWDSIKQGFWEKAFAAENGLTPTAEEIDQYAKYNKSEFAATVRWPANPWPASTILSNFHIEAVKESLLNNFARNFSYFRP